MERENVITTIRARLNSEEKPLFLHIANVIAGLIDAGDLPEGSKLPAYRILSQQLNVSEGTASRCYRELGRRGLVEFRTGDGSYVRSKNSRKNEGFILPPTAAPSPESNRPLINLAQNQFLLTQDLSVWKKQTDFSGMDEQEFFALMNYTDEIGILSHRETGAEWMRNHNLEISPDNIVCTNGSQHGIYLTLATVMQPHDAIAVDEYTYPGLLAQARQLSIRVVSIRHDEKGLCPADFAEKIKHNRITAVFAMPGIHNPLNYMMPDERRDEIAGICGANNLFVFEDETQGIIVESPYRPFYERLPGQTVLISSMSKAMASGLRVGYLAIPSDMRDRFRTVMRNICYMATPLSHEVATRSMASGFVDECSRRIRGEIKRRKELVAPALDGLDYASAPLSAHNWIALPDGFDDLEAAKALEKKGILVAPSSQFSSRAKQDKHYIRACVTTYVSDENLLWAFEQIRRVVMQF